MAGNKTAKVTPAAPAEGDTQQTAEAQTIQQQATDTAPPPVEQQTANQGGTNDKQEQALPVAPQAPQASAPGEAVAGLFEPNAIELVAKCERFRRAGRVFTREVSTIRLAELTEDEFKQLYGEPMLAVQLAYLAGED